MLLHVSVTASRQFLPISLCVSSMWHQRKTWGNYAILSLASQSQNSWIKRKKKRTSINGMWRFVPTLKYCDISLIGNTCRSQRLPEQKWVKMCFNETGFVTFDCSFIFFSKFFSLFFSRPSISCTQYKRLNTGHDLQLLVTIEKLPTSWHAWTGWELASSLVFQAAGWNNSLSRNKLLMQQTLKYRNKQQQVSQDVFYFLKAKNLSSQEELRVPPINSLFPCSNTMWCQWNILLPRT